MTASRCRAVGVLAYARRSVGCTPGGGADDPTRAGGGGGDADALCRVDEFDPVAVGGACPVSVDGGGAGDGRSGGGDGSGNGGSGDGGGGPAVAFFVLQSVTSPSLFKRWSSSPPSPPSARTSRGGAPSFAPPPARTSPPCR